MGPAALNGFDDFSILVAFYYNRLRYLLYHYVLVILSIIPFSEIIILVTCSKTFMIQVNFNQLSMYIPQLEIN